MFFKGPTLDKQFAIDELHRNAHVLGQIRIDAVKDLQEVINEYDPSITIIPRKKSFTNVKKLIKDINRYAEQDALLLYPCSSSDYTISLDQLKESFSTVHTNVYVGMQIAYGNDAIDVGVLATAQGDVRICRRKTKAFTDDMNTRKVITEFDDNHPWMGTVDDVLHARVCQDVAEYPITDGFGIVTAHDFSFEEQHLKGLQRSTAPIVILDSLRLGYYIIHPKAEKITYEL